MVWNNMDLKNWAFSAINNDKYNNLDYFIIYSIYIIGPLTFTI